MRIRKATVYRRRAVFIINRDDITVDGIPVATPDVSVHPLSVFPSVLGANLLAAMARARQGIPPIGQDQWGMLFEPVLRAAEVSSWRTFVRGARDLSVFEDGETIELLPSVNLGTVEGFEAVESQAIRVPRNDAERLGEAVIALLSEPKDQPTGPNTI